MARRIEYAREPRAIRSSVQQARAFFGKHRRLALYDHGRTLLTTARDIGMVEGRVVTDSRETMERRLANSDLALLMLYHSIEHNKLVQAEARGFAPQLPPDLEDSSLREQLRISGMLARMGREGRPLTEIRDLLQSVEAPLALLQTIVDYAVSHSHPMVDTPEEFIKPDNGSIFRTYTSLSEMERCRINHAKIAEFVYSRFAELFGYPTLAGDIIREAYRIRHPNIFDHVTGLYQDERSMEQLAYTQTVARRLASRIRKVFKVLGYEVSVELRLQKHEGKLMRKINKKMKEEYKELVAKGKTELSWDEYQQINLSKWGFGSISDTVAMRVIVREFGSKSIDEIEEEERMHIMQDADILLLTILSTFNELLREEDKTTYKIKKEFKERDNGYRAFHYDTEPRETDEGCLLLPFEAQLKTIEWDLVARHGKAAHYIFVGTEADQEQADLVEIVQAAYLDTVMKITGNGNGNGNGRLHK